MLAVLAAVSCASQDNTGAANKVALQEQSGLESIMPTADVTAAEAESAVKTIRPAIINGTRSRADWLSVQADGSIIATGVIDGNMGSTLQQLPGGERTQGYTFGLRVPETVGGVTVYHYVPLSATDDTPVSIDGRPAKASRVFGDQGDPTSHWVSIRFSLEKGWIRAEELTYTSREATWGAWPDDYPPSGSADEVRLTQDAGRPAQPKDPWLDVSAGSRRPFALRGYANGGVTADPPEQGLASSVDVIVPDRLGPAVIYHLAQVFFTNPDGANDIAAPPQSEEQELQLSRIPVFLRDGRLMAE